MNIESQAGTPRRPWLPYLGLAIAVLAVYANSLLGGFVWDDEVIVVQDPATGSLRDAFGLFLSPDMVKPYYRPLTRISFLLNHWVFGMNPAGFHLVNVLLHVANVLVLYALVSRLFSSRSVAFACALVFGVHPINTETVNFISARNNLLAFLFLGLSLSQFSIALARRSLARAWAAALMWLGALLSKESAGAGLALFVAFAAFPLGESRPSKRLRALALLPLAVTTGVYLVLRTFALGGSSPAEGLGLGHLADVVRINFEAIPGYLGLFFWPRDLTVFHELSGIAPAAARGLWLAWGAIAAVLAWLVIRRTTATTAGLIWLGVNFLPIANLVPIPSAPMAERYLYLPVAGLCLVVGDRAARAWLWSGRSRLMSASFLAVIGLLSTVTILRNQDWRDNLTLFRSSVSSDPRSPRALYNLGVASAEAGDLDGARLAWERALAVDPDDPMTVAQLGTIAAKSGDFAKAEMLYRKAGLLSPGAAIVHYNLGRLLEMTGRLRESLDEYEAFLRNAGPEDRERVAQAMEARSRVAAALRRTYGPTRP